MLVPENTRMTYSRCPRGAFSLMWVLTSKHIIKLLWLTLTAITGYHVTRTQKTWWLPRAGPHTPNRRVTHACSHQTLREFLLSISVSLLVEACAPPALMSLFVLSVPCCLSCLLLACPPFQVARTDQVCYPFLGEHSMKGVGPASQAVQAVLVYT